jgi:hypothetical protein
MVVFGSDGRRLIRLEIAADYYSTAWVSWLERWLRRWDRRFFKLLK